MLIEDRTKGIKVYCPIVSAIMATCFKKNIMSLLLLYRLENVVLLAAVF